MVYIQRDVKSRDVAALLRGVAGSWCVVVLADGKEVRLLRDTDPQEVRPKKGGGGDETDKKKEKKEAAGGGAMHKELETKMVLRGMLSSEREKEKERDDDVIARSALVRMRAHYEALQVCSKAVVKQ